MPRSFGVWKLDQKTHSLFAAPFYHVKLFGPGVNSFEPSQKIVKLECEKNIQDHKSCYLCAINVVTGEQIVRERFHVRADMLDACTKLRVIMSSDVSPDQLPIRVKFLIGEEPLTYAQSNGQIHQVFQELGYESSQTAEDSDSSSGVPADGPNRPWAIAKAKASVRASRPRPAASSKAIAKAKASVRASGPRLAASSKAIAKAKASVRASRPRPAASSKAIAKAKILLKKPAGKVRA